MQSLYLPVSCIFLHMHSDNCNNWFNDVLPPIPKTCSCLRFSFSNLVRAFLYSRLAWWSSTSDIT